MTVRVLSHVGGDMPAQIEAAVDGVEVVLIPGEGELDDGIQGEALFTLAWGTENLGHVLERGVRWIHTMGTGVDRFPLHLVGDQVLTCSRGASAVPISEWVLACMLAAEKRLPDAWIHEPPKMWNFYELGGLYGRTLGLIGLGGIGSAVADRALPFGMDVVAYRRTDTPAHRPEVEVATDLSAVLERADHLVVTAPATPETHHLLNAETLARVKPGVHLVNIARGTLVDQDALRAALDDDRIALASLDTVDPEPLPAGHWLYEHPKVRLSPHISWSMPGAPGLLGEMFAANLQRFLAGEPLDGVVDVAAGY